MSDNINNKNRTEPETEPVATTPQGKPTVAVISLLLTLAAWVALLWFNGYVAIVLAAAGAVCGFAGIPRRSVAVKRMAITAVIAAIVLIVVVASYLVVIKIGLS